MKSIFLLPLYVIGGGLFTGSPEFINPTGTYLLKGESKNSQIVGHYGELRVRLLDSTRIALAFYLNRGYPGYESGSFIDTLSYEDNRAEYRPAADSSCSVYFSFDDHQVEISQSVSDLNSGCGFRPGVIVPVLVPKTSAEVPVIQDLSVHGAP